MAKIIVATGVCTGVSNSPPELYECGSRCYFRAFSGLFPRFFYDMVTAARCPRTGIVPRNRAEVKRAFCSVSWQTGGASLRSAERVEQQSSKQGVAEDSCPFVFAYLFRCIMRGHLRNAKLQLWCNP